MTELVLCFPGAWKDRADFLSRIITLEPMGAFMAAGGILAHVAGDEHVQFDFALADPRMRRSFEVAGQGKIPAPVLDGIEQHGSVVYLHFPIALEAERARVLTFSQVLQRAGALAVKVESSGTAHAFDRWFQLLTGSLFDLYCAVVVLVGDRDYYYSCGMHHFGYPECAVPTSVPVAQAADLMNQFNFWQIADKPTVSSGHTFSVARDAPVWRLTLGEDRRHDAEDLFFNPHGVWVLGAAR